MTDDIVTRLRNETDDFHIFVLVIEAADEIERLQEEISRLMQLLSTASETKNYALIDAESDSIRQRIWQ